MEGEANSRDIPHLSYLKGDCIGSCDGDGADKLQHSPNSDVKNIKKRKKKYTFLVCSHLIAFNNIACKT